MSVRNPTMVSEPWFRWKNQTGSKVIMVKHIKFWKFWGVVQWNFWYNHIKMFNWWLFDKIMSWSNWENETESFLFLSLFMGTGVSPVRHGRVHVSEMQIRYKNWIKQWSAPPTRECLVGGTGVSPVRHGRAHVTEMQIRYRNSIQQWSTPPTRECLAGGTGALYKSTGVSI